MTSTTPIIKAARELEAGDHIELRGCAREILEAHRASFHAQDHHVLVYHAPVGRTNDPMVRASERLGLEHPVVVLQEAVIPLEELQRIPCPTTDDYETNMQKAGTGDPCPVCGRGIKNAGAMIIVDLSTNEVVPPEEYRKLEAEYDGYVPDTGAHPVGATCVKNHGLGPYTI